jgi:type II secretory pathway pseudopilin PulG
MSTGGRPRCARGFTILEVLVAMSIFFAMGTALVGMVYAAVDAWRSNEGRRRAYERAQEALAQISQDLEAVYAREPVQSGVPMARLFCTTDGEGQRLAFVRSFETGPERAFTYYASGKGGTPYTESFVGDPRTMAEPGGLLGVTYFMRGRELRRAVRGPPLPPAGADLAKLIKVTDSPGEVLADNVLFFGLRFWTQYTTSWKGAAPDLKKKKAGGPETIWDSTRGAGIGDAAPESGRTRPFCMYRGPESLAEPSDDVFPEIVEVTLVVEPDDRRAVKTELVEPMTESDAVAHVASTKGFDGPARVAPFLLIGSEWVKFVEKSARGFRISARGQRRTARTMHAAGAQVRIGTTFVLRTYVPAFREDWTGEADFLEKVRTR